MIQLVVHEYCHDCSLFEPKSISQVDYKVEGCKKHFVSCVHHTACVRMREQMMEEFKKRKKEVANVSSKEV